MLPFRWWIALAVLLAFGTLGASVGLMAMSAYLISKAALVTGFFDLAVAVTAVRALAIARAALRYVERYITHLATFRILTRLRVWYYSSFNEVSGRPGSLTSTTQYFPWYDLASTGMRGNTIHITNPGTSAVTGTIDLAGWASLPFSVGAGQDAYFMLPTGTFGGPVRISATGAVLTSLRALYYSSLNELAGSF